MAHTSIKEMAGKFLGTQKPSGFSAEPSTFSEHARSNFTEQQFPVTIKQEFSGCLLVKDDNAFLPEWIAYHSIALPLTSLIVAVDPDSLSSPRAILERFNGTLNWTLWHDEDYIKPPMPKWSCDIANPQRTDQCHRTRQVTFMSSCLREVKRAGGRWTALVDSDEYVVIKDDNVETKEGTKSRVYSLVHGVGSTFCYDGLIREAASSGKSDCQSQCSAESRCAYFSIWLTGGVNWCVLTSGCGVTKEQTKHRIEVYQKAPTTTTQVSDGSHRYSTALDHLHLIEEAKGKAHQPCLVLPRLFFSAMETPGATNATRGVPKETMQAVSTLRFRAHAKKGWFEHNGWPKTLVDVSRFRSFPNRARSPHRPLPECLNGSTAYETAPFRVHHYLGSWERYSGRNDPRRSREAFDKKALVNEGNDDSITSWFDELIDRIGPKRALDLLEVPGCTRDGLCS